MTTIECDAYRKIKEDFVNIELEIKRIKRIVTTLELHVSNGKINLMKYRMLTKCDEIGGEVCKQKGESES